MSMLLLDLRLQCDLPMNHERIPNACSTSPNVSKPRSYEDFCKEKHNAVSMLPFTNLAGHYFPFTYQEHFA